MKMFKVGDKVIVESIDEGDELYKVGDIGIVLRNIDDACTLLEVKFDNCKDFCTIDQLGLVIPGGATHYAIEHGKTVFFKDDYSFWNIWDSDSNEWHAIGGPATTLINITNFVS